MNTTCAAESAPIPPEPSSVSAVLRAPPGHKRNGKIAHLPKAFRDKINQWLDDGHTYPQIIKDLGDDAKDLKPNHFSEWRKGGYQDYVHQQTWRDELRLLRENGAEIKEFTDGPQFQETLIQLALTEIFRTLRNRELSSDSLNYIRIFNALARLNREALGLRKYNDLTAKEFQELKKLDPSRNLESERDIMLTALERSMGFPAAPGPIGPDLNDYFSSRKRDEADTNSAADNEASDPQTAASSSSSSSTPAEIPPSEATASPPTEPANAVPQIENPNSKFENPGEGHEEESASPSRVTHHASLPQSKIENLDLCPHCFAPEPPLLPSGERRFPHCQNCGTPLRPPGALIEYCPHCNYLLPELNSAGHRPTPDCPRCLNPLPPPAPDVNRNPDLALNPSQLPDAA
jgi:hypothetical protein